jgi:phage terminase small subunit
MTARRARFATEYLVDLNATQAAIRAGYSPKTAASQGERLLRNVEVSEAIRAGKAARVERTEITQDRVLQELACLAFSSVDHYRVDDDGKLSLREGAPENAMAAVSSIKRRKIYDDEGKETGVEVEFKLWDKPGPLKLAGRHVGLFPDRVEVTGKDGNAVRVDDTSGMFVALLKKLAGEEV